MSDLHNNKLLRRSAGHFRAARKASPNPFPYDALNPPAQGDLHLRDLAPRFSPTAVYSDDPAQQTTQAPPAGGGDTSAPAKGEFLVLVLIGWVGEEGGVSFGDVLHSPILILYSTIPNNH